MSIFQEIIAPNIIGKLARVLPTYLPLITDPSFGLYQSDLLDYNRVTGYEVEENGRFLAIIPIANRYGPGYEEFRLPLDSLEIENWTELNRNFDSYFQPLKNETDLFFFSYMAYGVYRLAIGRLGEKGWTPTFIIIEDSIVPTAQCYVLTESIWKRNSMEVWHEMLKGVGYYKNEQTGHILPWSPFIEAMGKPPVNSNTQFAIRSEENFFRSTNKRHLFEMLKLLMATRSDEMPTAKEVITQLHREKRRMRRYGMIASAKKKHIKGK